MNRLKPNCKKKSLSIAFLLILFIVATGCQKKSAPPYSVGADIPFVPQMEARGGVYYDNNNNEKDVCQIMADNNFDNIRLRIFVNPDAENGYSSGGEGFCGLEKTLEMAKRIKAAGMKFTLDFHYSDTWADPDKQFKPSVWEDIHGSALEGKICSA